MSTSTSSTTAPIFDRVEEMGVKILLFATILIGIAKILFGFALGFYNVYVEHGFKEAVLEKLSWILGVLGLAMIIFGFAYNVGVETLRIMSKEETDIARTVWWGFVSLVHLIYDSVVKPIPGAMEALGELSSMFKVWLHTVRPIDYGIHGRLRLQKWLGKSYPIVDIITARTTSDKVSQILGIVRLTKSKYPVEVCIIDDSPHTHKRMKEAMLKNELPKNTLLATVQAPWTKGWPETLGVQVFGTWKELTRTLKELG